MDSIQIGQVRVSRVIEIDTPNSPRFTQYLFPSLTAEQVAEHRHWMAPHYWEPESDRMRMNIQMFVVRTRHHLILVDTCIGDGKNRSVRIWHQRQGAFLEDLGRAGVRPDEVDYVLCTHLHVDHVGWNTRLDKGIWVPTFPKAKYLFAQQEWDYWKDKEGDGFGEVIADSVRPIVNAGLAQLVKGEYAIDDEAVILPTPGHTPGHVSLRLTSDGQEGLITGDMIHHPIQMAELDLTSGACIDPRQANATRRSFLERFAGSGARILGTHFAGPLGGRIVEKGKAFGLDWS